MSLSRSSHHDGRCRSRRVTAAALAIAFVVRPPQELNHHWLTTAGRWQRLLRRGHGCGAPRSDLLPVTHRHTRCGIRQLLLLATVAVAVWRTPQLSPAVALFIAAVIGAYPRPDARISRSRRHSMFAVALTELTKRIEQRAYRFGRDRYVSGCLRLARGGIGRRSS